MAINPTGALSSTDDDTFTGAAVLSDTCFLSGPTPKSAFSASLDCFHRKSSSALLRRTALSAKYQIHD